MEKFSISAQIRSSTVKPDHVRANKMTPAVVYGHKIAPQSLQLSTGDLTKLVRVAGQTHMIDLDIEGKKTSVLVHDVQRHPVTGDLVHVDFFAVSQADKITVHIPVKFVGVSPAVRSGAQLEQPIHSLEVRLLPRDLINEIEVDISSMVRNNDAVHVSALVSKYSKIEFITPLEDAIVIAKQFDEKALEEVQASETIAANEQKAENKAAA
jgi:large subunit ribosomal protein L25